MLTHSDSSRRQTNCSAIPQHSIAFRNIDNCKLVTCRYVIDQYDHTGADLISSIKEEKIQSVDGNFALTLGSFALLLNGYLSDSTNALYQGQNIPQGKRSLAYAITYRAPDRTLKDTEVQTAHDTIVKALASELGGVLRT